MRRPLCWLLLTALVLGRPIDGAAQERQLMSGSCHPASYIAAGAHGSDLAAQSSGYSCSAAIATTLGNGRTVVQFADKGSPSGVILGFAGVLDASRRKLLVDRVYLHPTEAVPATDGVCVLTRGTRRIAEMECVAIIDETEKRTLAAVYFRSR